MNMSDRLCTCRDVVDALDGYLERTLPPEQQRAVDLHLSRCDACVVYVRGYGQAMRLVRDAFD